MVNKYYFFIAILITFTACETVVEIDIPVHEPAIVIHCTPNDETLRSDVYVGKSLGILDNGNPEQISDAEVTVWRDGVFASNFIYGEARKSYISEAPLVFSAFGKYELRVRETDGTEHVVEQYLPTPPLVGEVEYDAVDLYDLFSGTDYDIIDFVLEDEDTGEEEYYFVHGYIRNKSPDREFYPIWTFSENPVMERTPESVGLIFSDASFNGNAVRFSIKVENYYYEPEFHDLYLKVSKMTADRYLYLRSMSRYLDALDNPFAEPVTIYSNIPGGYGIFGLENREMIFIK